MKNAKVGTLMMILIGLLTLVSGCAGLGQTPAAATSSPNLTKLESIAPTNHTGLAEFYEYETLRLAEQANHLLSSAEMYQNQFGADSKLAQEYKEFADTVLTKAEKATTLRQLHQSQAREIAEDLAHEMLPQP